MWTFAAIIITALISSAATLWIGYRFIEKYMDIFHNDTIKKHLREVSEMYGRMSEWRHDYKSQIQTMKAYISQNHIGLLSEYLDKLDSDLTSVDTVIKTGNIMIDAIINSKLSVIRSKNIKITIDAAAPAALSVPDVDLCHIIGNLLENAAESAEKCPDGGFVRIYINTLKNQFYISVLNSTAGDVLTSGGEYRSTKPLPGHGLGLKSVARTVNKYGGWIEQCHDEDLFSTEILLPL